MAEENQVQQEPQQITTKEPQQVTTKNLNKVKAGKRLAEYNRRKREEKKTQSEASRGVNQYYGTGAVIAVGVIGSLGYYIYQTKKGEEVNMPHNPTVFQPSPHLSLASLRWSKSILYYKNGQEEYSK